jgi:tetratricopeptide (TPR) repeat protein
MTDRKRQPQQPAISSALLALAVVAATFVVYWPALRGDFIWDDDVMLRNNPYVKSPGGLYYIWCSTRLPDFFPLTSTSFWLEWRLWGLRPAGYHVTNVLLHAASAVLIWRVLRRLAVPAAWLAALVFALHPVNVESVAWITERKNTLSMFFYLLSLLLYLRFDSLAAPPNLPRSTLHAPRSCYLLSLAAFLLALLSKTSVVMLPFVLLGCAWWRRGRIGLRDVFRSVPFFGLSLALGLVTIWFQYHRAIGGDVVYAATFWARLAGAGRAVWFYLGKALFPWPLSFVYPRWEIDARSGLAYVPVVSLLLATAVFWRYRGGWGRAALFGLGYFVLMLAPVLGFLNIYFQRYSLVADHWQYYAIIGVIALAVGAASKASREGFASAGLRVAAGVVVVVLGASSWRQAGLYANPATVWRDTVAKNPGCWMAYNNLGLAMPDTAAGREQAIAYYRESLRLQPAQDEAHLNLGSALMRLRRLDEAKAEFEAAAKFCPTNSMTHYNLGLLFEEQGKSGEAMSQYRRAIELWPEYAEAHNNLGAALQLQGNQAAAEAEFTQSVRLQPDLARARSNLGLALLARGQADAAIAQFLEALRLQPDYPEAYNNLAKALAERGKLADALAALKEAVRLKPDYADAQYNLGNTLLLLGQLPEAIPPYLAALQARPDFAQVHEALGLVSSVLGKTNEALDHFSAALRLNPDSPVTHYGMGDLRLKQGNAGDAALHFRAALKSRPDYPEARYQLATILAGQGQTPEALDHLREAVRLKPDWLEALNNLAWLLATQPEARLRNGPEAVRLAAHAVELTRTNNPGTLDTLAAAYAEAGRYPAAAEAAQKAANLAQAAGQKELASVIRLRWQSYQAGKPFRE